MNKIRQNSQIECLLTNAAMMRRRIVSGRFGVLALAAVFVLGATGCASQAAVEKAATENSTPVAADKAAPEDALSVLAETANEAIRQADQALEQGELDRALYLYITALDLGETGAETYYKIGLIHREQGNTAPATLAFKNSLRSDPGHAGAWEALGLIMLMERREDSAYESLTMAVVMDPKRWRAHNGLGVIADLRHDYAEALESYRAALEINSESPAIFNNRGYSRYMSGDFDGAGHDFAMALTLDSKFTRGWQNLALLEMRRENYELAYRHLTRIMDDAEAFNDMGYFSMLAGKHDLADKFFRESVRLSPSYNKVANENIDLNRELRELNANDVPMYGNRPLIDVAPLVANLAFVEGVRATLYEQPERESRRLGELEGGTLVTVIAKAGNDWSKIEHEDAEAGDFMQGWIRERDLIMLQRN